MSGVAIEDLLELWSAELRKAKAKLGWLIDHPSVLASAAAFLDTLLGPERAMATIPTSKVHIGES